MQYWEYTLPVGTGMRGSVMVGGQFQYPRENCYLRQLPSTFIGKSGDELVTNLQGYLKVGNVNPQAVNF